MVCPKCGSDQILNDQCIKCGIVVTKYKATTQANAPVSFVAPKDTPRAREEFSYSLPQATVQSQEDRLRSRRNARLVTLGVLILLILASYFVYTFLRQRASRISGVYRNLKLIYVMRFPEPESEWFHYASGEAETPLFETAEDAFYRGGDPDDPEIAMGVWVIPGNIIPERIDSADLPGYRTKIEDDLLQRLETSGVGGSLTTSDVHMIGGNQGFRLECDLVVEEKPWKLIALRGQYLGFGHWFYFAGPAEMMERHSEEVEKLIKSLDYKTSVI